MFKNLFIICLLVLMISFNQLFSQNLRVSLVNGDVSLFENSTNNWSKVKTGILLPISSKLKLAHNSFVVFYDIDSKLQKKLDVPGIYAVKELFDNKSPQNSSTIISRLLDLLTGNIKKSLDNKSSIPGSVVRSGSLDIISPFSGSYFIDPIVSFEWENVSLNENTPQSKNYNFIICNLDNDTLFNSLVPDTSISLNLDSIGLSRNIDYFWQVSLPDYPDISSNNNYFKILDTITITKLIDSVEILKRSFDDKNSQLYYLCLAEFFKERSIHIEAIKYFKKALEIAPDFDELSLYYKNYLYSLGQFK